MNRDRYGEALEAEHLADIVPFRQPTGHRPTDLGRAWIETIRDQLRQAKANTR